VLEQELYQTVKALYCGACGGFLGAALLLVERCFVDRLLPGEQLPWQQSGNGMALL
jgi:hypothetical protein